MDPDLLDKTLGSVSGSRSEYSFDPYPQSNNVFPRLDHLDPDPDPDLITNYPHPQSNNVFAKLDQLDP